MTSKKLTIIILSIVITAVLITISVFAVLIINKKDVFSKTSQNEIVSDSSKELMERLENLKDDILNDKDEGDKDDEDPSDSDKDRDDKDGGKHSDYLKSLLDKFEKGSDEDDASNSQNENVSLSKDEWLELNEFLTGFISMGLSDFEEVDDISEYELLSFLLGIISHTDYGDSFYSHFVTTSDYNYHIAEELVDIEAERYFGIKLKEHGLVSEWIDYEDGFYSFPMADGEAFKFPLVSDFIALEDNRYLVYFNIYLDYHSSYDDWKSGVDRMYSSERDEWASHELFYDEFGWDLMSTKRAVLQEVQDVDGARYILLQLMDNLYTDDFNPLGSWTVDFDLSKDLNEAGSEELYEEELSLANYGAGMSFYENGNYNYGLGRNTSGDGTYSLYKDTIITNVYNHYADLYYDQYLRLVIDQYGNEKLIMDGFYLYGDYVDYKLIWERRD